ncbi:hypothetical protein [Lentzea guizhouensis]|uniref:hypothetical protein n=1 Tax=Lentzea guizhouensis TaxID=1586287 RepID=UPI0012B6925C|nr:hypothetical protein [Lentzea guizhouensis]
MTEFTTVLLADNAPSGRVHRASLNLPTGTLVVADPADLQGVTLAEQVRVVDRTLHMPLRKYKAIREQLALHRLTAQQGLNGQALAEQAAVITAAIENRLQDALRAGEPARARAGDHARRAGRRGAQLPPQPGHAHRPGRPRPGRAARVHPHPPAAGLGGLTVPPTAAAPYRTVQKGRTRGHNPAPGVRRRRRGRPRRRRPPTRSRHHPGRARGGRPRGVDTTTAEVVIWHRGARVRALLDNLGDLLVLAQAPLTEGA